jgi:hypothetical protein
MAPLLLAALALAPATPAEKFRDVRIEEPYATYLLAQPRLMSVAGAKVVRLKDGNRMVLGIGSTALEGDGPKALLEAEKVCREKALASVVAVRDGVQVAQEDKVESKTVVVLTGGKHEYKSVEEALSITRTKVRGIVRGMGVVGRWRSGDGKVLYLAVGIICDRGGDPVSRGETVIRTPQPAVITFNTGRSFRGTLRGADGEAVRLQLKPGQAATRYDVKQVLSILTADGLYAFNARAGRWELVWGAKPSPAETPVAAVQRVEAEGVGATVEQARKDAIREAVRMASGVMVIGRTTVKDDRLIRDKVLTYAEGVIEPGSYKELERRKEGGAWRVKVNARVISRKLAERLTGAGLKVRGVDGAGIAAAVASKPCPNSPRSWWRTCASRRRATMTTRRAPSAWT